MTAADALQIGDELRQYVSSVNPGWPSKDDRLVDLAVHVRVAESLRRVAKSG